jgi:hypothetical protein
MGEAQRVFVSKKPVGYRIEGEPLMDIIAVLT